MIEDGNFFQSKSGMGSRTLASSSARACLSKNDRSAGPVVPHNGGRLRKPRADRPRQTALSGDDVSLQQDVTSGVHLDPFIGPGIPIDDDVVANDTALVVARLFSIACVAADSRAETEARCRDTSRPRGFAQRVYSASSPRRELPGRPSSRAFLARECGRSGCRARPSPWRRARRCRSYSRSEHCCCTRESSTPRGRRRRARCSPPRCPLRAAGRYPRRGGCRKRHAKRLLLPGSGPHDNVHTYGQT